MVKGDIQEEAHCKHIIDTAVNEFGGLDILVNNAAFQMARQSIAEIPSEEWDRTFQTSFFREHIRTDMRYVLVF